MRILALNAGSSSLKFRLVGTSAHDGVLADVEALRHATLARGAVTRLGRDAVLELEDAHGSQRREITCADHPSALKRILAELQERNVLHTADPLATGHRIVHGGTRYRVPTIVTRSVLADLRSHSSLAPLHNAAACRVVEQCMTELGDRVPAVAVFDTAFHVDLPPHAAGYAIPWQLAEKHGVRRSGFHGLAHQWMSERWSLLTRRPRGSGRLISLQLGHGCSAAAMHDGRSLDVTMGFTPLEGLMMSTRSGDVDPALVPFLAEREAVDARTVEQWLNTQSGLLGVSGASADLRELLASEARGDTRARLAVEMFCYRIRKAIGAMQAVLGGVDAILYSGGIGQHSAEVRARTAGQFGWSGVELDSEKNAAPGGGDRCISSPASGVEVWVIPAEEELLIARAVLQCLRAGR